jgi:hypothetical protein
MADGSAFCVCILFYGSDDYCRYLAERVLNRPMAQLAKLGVEFRFGFNAIGAASRQFIEQQLADSFAGAYVVDCPENIFKYPIMRRLFYDRLLTRQFVLWFDDNSYILPDTDAEHWLARIERQLNACHLLGSVYTGKLVGNQKNWIAAQSWYANKPPNDYVKYVIDSWWAARTEKLLIQNWPAVDIRHHGGDIMLGEFCRQQDLSICHFRDGVAINTNSSGVEGVKISRGFDAPPVGFDYRPTT